MLCSRNCIPCPLLLSTTIRVVVTNRTMKVSIALLLLWTVGLVCPGYSHVVERIPGGVADEGAAVPAAAVEHLAGGGLRGGAGNVDSNTNGELSPTDRRLQGWADGTYCWLGSSCNNCQNPATWWYSIGWTACGTFTCIPDGVQCSIFVCSKCCNGPGTASTNGWSNVCGSIV